jgi:hypothetical protein
MREREGQKLCQLTWLLQTYGTLCHVYNLARITAFVKFAGGIMRCPLSNCDPYLSHFEIGWLCTTISFDERDREEL